LLPHLTADQRSDHWHLVTPQLDDLTRGKGLIALLGELTRTRRLSRALSWLRADRLLDGFDSVLQRIKGKLGRLVPNVEGPRRCP
jgi:hypothetical protein